MILSFTGDFMLFSGISFSCFFKTRKITLNFENKT